MKALSKQRLFNLLNLMVEPMPRPACPFKKEMHLLSTQDFSRVFEHAARSADQFFTILAIRNNLAYGRLGLAIAKKNIRHAHQRNLIKRISRESFRLHQNDLTGLDIVVMVKPKISLDDRKVLHDSLNNHWKRIIKRCIES